MRYLQEIRNNFFQWIVFSGLAYLFIAGAAGLFFHKGPLINSGDQFADIPLWANTILIVLSAGVGAYASNKENKGRR
ncbi:hypothetical protein D3C77_301080 [compost metagenome]